MTTRAAKRMRDFLCADENIAGKIKSGEIFHQINIFTTTPIKIIKNEFK